MANDALFLELAKALSQPSKAYRAANTGLGAVEQGIQGFREGGQIGDEIRKRKLEQQTLSDALGGQPLEQGISNLTAESGALQHPNIAMAIALMKAKKANEPKPRNPADFYTPAQADAVSSGDPKKLQAAFATPVIPGTDTIPRTAVAANTTSRGVTGRNEFYVSKGGQIRLDQLPSNMSVSTNAGAAAQVKMAARQGKALIAKATSPQNLKLASVDLTRAVARMAPDAATIGESNYGNSLPTLIGQLTQKIDADPSSPDVPKLRKQIYDTLNELDKAATPFIQQHLNNYQRTIGSLDPETINQELGNNLPDIPFEDSSNGIPQQGMIRIKASDGTVHDIPQQNFGKAKQIDPGAQVIQ